MRDECGYIEHAERIANYNRVHTPESVLPFVHDSAFPEAHPDGCSVCNKATWWESRILPDLRLQVRCTECKCVITFDTVIVRKGA